MPRPNVTTILIVLAAALLTACSAESESTPTPDPTRTDTSQATPAPEPTSTAQPSSTPQPISTPEPEPSPTRPASPTPQPTATPAPEPTPEPTPNPATEPVPWYIDSIASKEYDGCCLERLYVYEEGANYTAWVIAYQGDGLRLTGLMAVPHGDGPFPVAIFNHGYMPLDEYDHGYDTLREVRYMTSNGYIAVAPDYRNYAGSDEGDNIFDPGYVYDVRNLIPALQELDEVDGDAIGMFGHSMGGGITLQSIVTGAEIQAAVLYGTVTGDEAERYEARMTRWSSGGSPQALQFSDRYGTPEESPEIYARMSAGNYLDRVEVPVLIHHGDADTSTPIEWAYDIEAGLREAGKDVEMHVYPGAGHSFQGQHFDLMMQRTLAFFDEHVR